MKKISVPIPDNDYDIFIGKDIFKSEFQKFLKKSNYSKILFIADQKAYELHKKKIDELSLNQQIYFFTLISNENNKTLQTVSKIYSKALEIGCDRNSLFAAFGGGIIGDIVGYAAATFMRGIDFIQIPTTLLAAVDSSVGGKTGVNFKKIKNIIGAFKQPKTVIIDLSFLQTLEEEEIRCGLGEIIKYAFITNEDFYKFVKKKLNNFSISDYKSLEKLVIESVKFKASVVIADETEKSLRQILNFGHTFGHAYETCLNYKIKHGEAVAAGCVSALVLSHKLNLIDRNSLENGIEIIKRFELNKLISKINAKKAYSIMFKDKKNKKGQINFVLLKGIGETLINVNAKESDIIYAIEETKKIANS